MTRKTAVRMTKHQGREITATLQAPDSEQLGMMLAELRDYCVEVGLEPFKILKKGSDPDGGYRAIIVAHNWNIVNPLRWLKEKYEEGGFTPEEKASLKEIGRQVKYQRVRAKRVARGAAEIRLAAARAAAGELRKMPVLPKKLKVEAEIPVYGAKALKAREVAAYPTTPFAGKAPEKILLELTESGKRQALTTEEPLLLELLDGPKTLEYLATVTKRTPKTVQSQMKSLVDMGLVRERSAVTASPIDLGL